MDFFHKLISTDGFTPHGCCYMWQAGVLWLNVISDALITLAYYSIPFTLFYFIRKRHDLPFNWIFLCFAVFIVACGTTHLMEIIVIWHPAYWLAGTIKAITAAASVPTAILLVRLLPQALTLPSPTRLQTGIAGHSKMERKFKGLLESAPDAIVIVDEHGEIALVNSQAEQMFGWPRAELLGKKMEVLVPERFRGQHPGHREQFTGNSKARPMGAGLELYGLRKNGTEFPVEISLSPLETEDGTLISSAIRDITDRRAREATLRESEERFRHAFDDAPIGVVLITPQGRFLRANRALCSTIGYSEAELLDKNFQSITHPDDLDKNLSLLNETLAGKRVSYRMEKRSFHKNGEIIYARLNASLIRDPNGEPLYFITHIENISETKKHELEREKLIVELQSALARVKTLSGLIPICGWCKNVRSDQGYWQTVEQYVHDQTAATFTHGVCPTCAEKFKGDIIKAGGKPDADAIAKLFRKFGSDEPKAGD